MFRKCLSGTSLHVHHSILRELGNKKGGRLGVEWEKQLPPRLDVLWCPSFLFLSYAIRFSEDKQSTDYSTSFQTRDRVCPQWCSAFPANWDFHCAREELSSTWLGETQVRWCWCWRWWFLSLTDRLLAAGEVSVSPQHCRLQTRHVCQSSSLLSDKAGPGPGGPDKTEGGGGGSLLCPKCGSPCEHVATFISSTR